MKRVLMATDLSARSDRALQRAIAIAAVHGAELEIVNVVDDTLPQSIVDFHVEAAKSAIEAQVWALPTAKGLRPVTRIRLGEDFVEILRHAEAFHADLIVLGIHRHSSKHLFRGTTAERIVRMGRVPVLVVSDPVVHSYARVLVAVDLSPHSRAALQLAARLAPEAAFLLVHALDVPYKTLLEESTVAQIVRDEAANFADMMQQDLTQLAAQLGKRTPHFDFVAELGLPRAVLDAQIEKFKPDLIAVGTHSRSRLTDALLGSLTEELLTQPPTDVLAAKAW